MEPAIRPAARARPGLRWQHVVLAVVAALGVIALVANLFGA